MKGIVELFAPSINGRRLSMVQLCQGKELDGPAMADVSPLDGPAMPKEKNSMVQKNRSGHIRIDFSFPSS